MAVTIRSGSKTGSKTSSYANVRAAVESNQKKKSSALSSGSVSKSSGSSVRNAPAPSITTPTQEVVQQKRQEGTFENPFFSIQGQKERLSNVGSVFKTLFTGGDRIYTVNPSTGIRGRDVTTPLRIGVGAAALPLAYGAVATAAPGLLTGSSTVAGVASSGAGFAGLKALGIAAGVGAIAGYSLRSGGNAPQTQSQTQNPSISTDSRQYNTQDSRQYNTQDTRYTIKGSPGASIAGSPSQSPSLNPYQAPTQSTPSSISAQQEAAQTQSGSDWLIPALIAVGAIFLTRK